MTNTIITSSKELERVQILLGKKIPSYRQAYSDRTAWLMACMSELAYIRFNPLFSQNEHKKFFLDNISKLIGNDSKSSLVKLIGVIGYDSVKEKENLESELKKLTFKLIKTFDSDGTQAILVSNDKYITLAFRGTEATSPKDIKSDLKAKTMSCETGGKIHTGFNESFRKVELSIQNKLNESEFETFPLFITGHSLGGALATIATKKLSHKGGIAACYTFGSPRVGDDEWITNIKPPMYRVVNAADCVTMLPPGDELISLAVLPLQLIAWFRFFIISKWCASLKKWLVSNFGGYLHGGDMRYMTNISGNYNEVKLLYSVSFFRRIKAWLIKKRPWKKFLADHSISVYRKKLMYIAEKRNCNSKK